jgi:hypothetical protein
MAGNSAYTGLLFELTGDKRIDARLKRLERNIQSRIASAACTAAIRVIAKAQKSAAEIPAEKKAIGSRVKKSGADDVVAKAGVGVGKKRKPKAAGQKLRQARGIKNVTWYILGTEARFTGAKTWKSKGGAVRTKSTDKPRAFRGRMRAHLFLRQASESAMPRAIEKAREVANQKLDALAAG